MNLNSYSDLIPGAHREIAHLIEDLFPHEDVPSDMEGIEREKRDESTGSAGRLAK